MFYHYVDNPVGYSLNPLVKTDISDFIFCSKIAVNLWYCFFKLCITVKNLLYSADVSVSWRAIKMSSVHLFGFRRTVICFIQMRLQCTPKLLRLKLLNEARVSVSLHRRVKS